MAETSVLSSGAPSGRKEERRQRKKREVNEDVEELAQALFVYWKTKDLLRTTALSCEDANELAEQAWLEEVDDATAELFRTAAAVQIVILGGEYIAPTKRRPQKYATAPTEHNRAECNPFLLYCRDHKENVREKGARGKGMMTLSGMWKQLPESEKEVYQQKARENKMRQRAADAALSPIKPAEGEPPEEETLTPTPRPLCESVELSGPIVKMDPPHDGGVE